MKHEMKCTCMNCGHEFTTDTIFCDEMGTFTVCPECEGSFDVDINERRISNA